MGFIPVGKKPYPDELLYSWIHRLATANSLLLKDFLIEYLGKKNATVNSLQPDVRREFVGLYDSLLKKPDMVELFLSVSTFPFEAMFMTEGQQTKYVNNVFTEKSNINTISNGIFQQLHVCQECAKEDIATYGEAYLHRIHHLSGVKVCPKHHCTLMRFDGTKGHACDYDWATYFKYELTSISDTVYADYVREIFDAGVTTDIKSLKDILYSTLKDRGYSVSDAYESFNNDLHSWQYSNLIKMDIPHFLKVKMITAEHISPEELMPLFMFLYPAVNEMISLIQKADSNPLLEIYHCDICHRDYISTPFAELNGFGCSFCNKYLSESSFVSRVFETNGYSANSKFKSMNRKIELIHHKCGHHMSMTPRSFIYEGVRCMCESVITEVEAKKTISELGNYNLCEFTSAESLCKIRARDCGHIFNVRYRKFVCSPYCRICFPRNMTTECLRDRIVMESDGEYEMVGDFVNQNTKISVLHHVCGQTTEYSSRYFYMGARCPLCNSVFVEQWERMYALLLDYKAEHGNISIPKRAVYKGEKLGLWCQHQRDNYNCNKRTMTPERVKKLSDIGFDFDPKETEWNRRYEQYLRYIEEKSTTYISRRTDYEDEHLGAWVETQRKWYKTGKMSDERKEKLLKVNPLFFES